MALTFPPIPEDPQALDAEIARTEYLVAAGEKDAPTSDDFTRPTMYIVLAQNKEWLRRLLEAREARTAKPTSLEHAA